MNEKAAIFKPEPVKLVLEDQEFALKYTLNAFVEMEKLYDSVDEVIQMLLGQQTPDMEAVFFKGVACSADDVEVGGTPLSSYIAKLSKTKKATHADTLNLLWLACLHDHALCDEDGNIIRYTITKNQLGSLVTFRNLKEVNGKIVEALLRDLLPAVQAAVAEKNVQAAEPTELAE